MYELDVTSWQPREHADTHERLNLHPQKIEVGDRYRYSGRWLTVYQITTGAKGLVLHFAELVHGAAANTTIPEGTLGVTVYRAKEDGA